MSKGSRPLDEKHENAESNNRGVNQNPEDARADGCHYIGNVSGAGVARGDILVNLLYSGVVNRSDDVTDGSAIRPGNDAMAVGPFGIFT